MAYRIVLLIAVNLAMACVFGLALYLLGLDRSLIYVAGGLDLRHLMIYALVYGFVAAFISLLMSKPLAKWFTGARIVTKNAPPREAWLVTTVERLAAKAGIGQPEVAIYEGGPNAYATGARRNSALVAVSTGLLDTMQPDEIEAVLAHEIAHIANGDMITMTLLQGVLNACVLILSRGLAFLIDKTVFRGNSRGISHGAVLIVLQIVLGLVAAVIAAAYSRRREYRADAGAATLLGTPQPMIRALQSLARADPQALPAAVQSLGIIGARAKWLTSWMATHPPLDARIAALRGSSPTL